MADRAVVEQGINWVMAFVVGVVAIGFGIYLLTDPGNATALIVGIVSFALLLGSLIHLLQGLRRHANEFAARAAILSGGVGVTVGSIVTLDLFYDYLNNPAARVILASGLIVYGVLGLAGMVVQRVEGTVVRTIVTCAFALGFAALLLYYSQDDELNTNWFAIALVVTGILLLGLGYFARNHQSRLLERRDRSSGPAAPRPANTVTTGQPGKTAGSQTAEPSLAPFRPADRRPGTDPITATNGAPSSEAISGSSGGPAPIIAQPSGSTGGTGQPGQDTRNRLLDRDGAHSSDKGPRGGQS